MSFYITLPSNGADYTSEYGKKNNSQTDFSTELKEAIVFENDNYEVALVECSYRKNWIVDLGTITIFESNEGILQIKESLKVYMFDGVSITSLLLYINDSLSKINFVHDQLKNKVTMKINKDCSVIIKGYLANLFAYFLLEYKTNVMTSDKSLEEMVRIRSENVIVQKDPPEITVIYHEKIDFKFRLYMQILKYVEEIFVGTNIVKESLVGRSMAPLLKTLTETSEFDQVVSHQIQNPHYISINYKTINKIRIFMEDSNGERIKFSDSHSRVVYKLHFRQIEKINYTSNVN